jgi:hypothetical protein
VIGTHPDGGVDWGLSGPITTYASTPDGTVTSAFTTSFELASAHIDLEGNFNRGVLVLACYTRYKDPARAPTFLREYFAVGAAPPSPLPAVMPLAGARPGSAKLEDLDAGIAGPLDATGMAGHFVNTKATSLDLLDVTIQGAGAGACSLRLRGNSPEGAVDWGAAVGEVYTCIEEDTHRSLTLRVVHRLEVMHVVTQIRNNKGVTVVATFAAWSDASGRSNYFTREFFRRV